MKKLNVTSKFRYQAFYIKKDITDKELSEIFNNKVIKVVRDLFWSKVKLNKGTAKKPYETEFVLFYESYLVKQYLNRKLIDILQMPKSRFNKYFTVLNEVR